MPPQENAKIASKLLISLRADFRKWRELSNSGGLFRADSGFYDKAIVAFLKGCKINHIISARLTQALQQAMVDLCRWQDVAPGLQISELRYQPHGWEAPQRLVVIRQHMQRKAGGVPGKTLSLFADDPDLQGWRYGAMLTDMSLPAGLRQLDA